MTDKFSYVSHALEKYERFVDRISTCFNEYLKDDDAQELVRKISEAELNSPKSGKVPLQVHLDELNPLEDYGEQQLLRKAWRSVAKLTHPDLGGDPRVFVYARTLYKSNDIESLNLLLESLSKGDFSSYLGSVNKKLNALYELKKASVGYKVLVLDMEGKSAEAKSLVIKALEKRLFDLLFK